MRLWGWRLKISLLAAVLAGAPLGAMQSLPPGALARAVAEAKQAGRTATTILSMAEAVAPDRVENATRNRSVWLAKVDARLPMPVATADRIYTWRLLHVTKRLADSSDEPEYGCDVPLPPQWPVLGPDDVAVATYGGTMTFDGVTVTVREGEAHIPALVALQNYVLVGRLCRPGVMSLEIEYPVAGNGALLWPSGRPIAPAITVDGLSRMLNQQ